MGFRFSRRIGILPGLRLNLSGSGVSLSAGVRGAHVTLGPRGAYTSVGLPGTGISYRQRVGGGRRFPQAPAARELDLNAIGNRANDELAQKLFQGGEQTVSLNAEEARRYLEDPRFRLMDPQTGRRLTRQQLEARIKAADTEAKVHQVQAALQAEADEYQQRVNFWKPLPQIPSREDWVQAQEKKPLEPQFSPPTEPDWVECQAKLLEELTEKHAATELGKLLPHFLAKAAAEKEFPTAWPEREAQLQNAHAQQVQQYEERLAQESAAWDQLEAERVAWIRRLLGGDLEEVHHTVAEVLQGLRFPFKTRCDFFLKDCASVYLHLDLPQIEDIIPEAQQEVLKDGGTRTRPRPREERNADYAQLAMGQCLYLAAELFSYLPLAQLVQLAAYTQRPRVRETDPIDTYVLDVPFEREGVRQFNPEEQHLVSFLSRQGGRFRVLPEDNSLAKIEPPSWLTQADLEAVTQ
jgi:hypothetical protein